MIQKWIEPGMKPTAEQMRELEAASRRPVRPDESAPELTPEQYAEMARMARARRREQIKPVVAIRISPDSLAKAKAVGRGYTGFLSRLIDNAINDPAMVQKSL